MYIPECICACTYLYLTEGHVQTYLREFRKFNEVLSRLINEGISFVEQDLFVVDSKGVFRTQSTIYEETFFAKIIDGF